MSRKPRGVDYYFVVFTFNFLYWRFGDKNDVALTFYVQSVRLLSAIQLLSRVALLAGDLQRRLVADTELVSLCNSMLQTQFATEYIKQVESWMDGSNVSEKFPRLYIEFILAKAETLLQANKVGLFLTDSVNIRMLKKCIERESDDINVRLGIWQESVNYVVYSATFARPHMNNATFVQNFS